LGSSGPERHLRPTSIGFDLTVHKQTPATGQVLKRAARFHASVLPGGDDEVDLKKKVWVGSGEG
jgi:hypothetical protein